VDRALDDDLAAHVVEAGVERRELAQRFGHRLHDVGQEREPRARPLGLVLERRAVRDEIGEVALRDEGERRRGRERVAHVLGDLPPQPAERHALVAGRVGGGRRRGRRRGCTRARGSGARGLVYVGRGDRAAGARAREALERDAQLLRELAHGGRCLTRGAAAGGAGACCTATAGAADSAARCCAAAAGCDAPAPSFTSIDTIVVPTFTISPSLAWRPAMVPVRGDGISTLALSVITSTSGWSSRTASPTLTSQRTISPSATPSPMSGNFTSNAIATLRA
jgi:hypothetical protein